MTESAKLAEMLSQLGWGSGFKLPIANEENKQLEKLLEEKQKKLVHLNTKLQETNLSLDNSAAFYKLLQSKIRHGAEVERAKRSQFEKEKHFHALAERDHAKHERDVKDMEKRLWTSKTHNKKLEGNVLRRKDALGELVDIINFDKRAIAEYENKFNKEDAYLRLMDDFGDTDKEKFLQYQKEYRELGEKIANSRVLCSQTVQESEIMEGELESLAKQFRKAHKQRSQFIENWKGTLAALEGRDKEIMEITYDAKVAARYVKKATDLVAKQEAFLQNVQSQTRAHQIEFNRIERSMAQMNSRKQQEVATGDDLTEAITDQAHFIMNMEREMRKIRKELKKLCGDTCDWAEKVADVQRELDELKAKYDLFAMESMTSAEQVKQLEDFLDKEEGKEDTLSKELTKQTAFKSQKEMQSKTLKEDLVLADVHMRSLNFNIGATQKKFTSQDELLLKKKAVEYGLDLQCMAVMAKIRNVENPEERYTGDEYRKLIADIAVMKEKREELFKTQNLLRSQATHCDNVINLCKKEILKEGKQNQQYETDLHILSMGLKRLDKENELAVEQAKDVGVNNSLLHVQLSRMIHSVKDYEDKLLDLEQERVTLHTVVKGRKKDIENYYALLQTKKRTVQDECQKLKLQIYELNLESQGRKRRYEMLMLQMWKAGGDDDDAKGGGGSQEEGGRSEAYYIIKLAQQREHYKAEGDKWDARVKEAEKIVEGLQNTLALMMSTNEAFKDSLSPATSATAEGRQLDDLKEKEYEAVHNLKVLRRQRKEYQGKVGEMQHQLNKVSDERNSLEYVLMEKQYDLKNLIIEINGQKEKIRRATLQANKLVKELSQLETLDAELLQNDLRLRITKEKYEFACATLEKLLSIHPNLIEEAMSHLDEKGMQSLKTRLGRKLGSSTATSPGQSGRSTPQLSTRRNTGSYFSGLAPSRQAIQNSLIFKKNTGDRLQVVNNDPQESDISFTDLRQALKDAASDQRLLKRDHDPSISKTDVVELLDNKKNFHETDDDHPNDPLENLKRMDDN